MTTGSEHVRSRAHVQERPCFSQIPRPVVVPSERSESRDLHLDGALRALHVKLRRKGRFRATAEPRDSVSRTP
jgi:hypothetical protein